MDCSTPGLPGRYWKDREAWELQFVGSQKVSHNLANWITTDVQFSCSVISYSFGSHGLQHTRLPGPSQLLEPTQTHVRWVSDAIQPSHPLSSPYPPAFNLSQHQSLQMCQFFTSGGQSIGASASVSVLPMNIQDWFPLELTGLLSFCSPRDSQESSVTLEFKSITSSALSFLYTPTLTTIHDTGKTIALTRWTCIGKVMSLLFNMLSRLVITFLPRSKHLLISWLQSPSAVILVPPK